MDNKPGLRPIPPATLHRIYGDKPAWNDPRAYRPDTIELLRANARARPSYFATLAADWRDVLSEVRGSPYSHALVAILTVIVWTAALVIPTLIGVGK